MANTNGTPEPPAGAETVGDWEGDERMCTMPRVAFDDLTVGIDAVQSRQGFTTSLVSVTIENQVILGGIPVAVSVTLWPDQARELAQQLLELTDQCDAMDATVPI